MSKFNLSSVYSKDNIYSVLKLLKALIDTLDNYEFQAPIKDRDGNEIPNEWFAKLYNSIHGSYNGDIEVGKDAHIDGNINVDFDATIGGLLKLGSSAMLGYISYPDGPGAVPAIMQYRIDNGSVIIDTAIAFDTTSSMLLSWFNLGNVTYANGVYTTTISPTMVDLTSVEVNTISGLYGDVTALKNRVNKVESTATTARTEASNALAKTNTLEADVSSINQNIQTMQADIENLPARNIDATEPNEIESLGTSFIGDFTYDGNVDCAVFGKVVQNQSDFTLNGLVVFDNGKAYIAKDAFISSTGELHSGTMTPFPSSGA